MMTAIVPMLADVSLRAGSHGSGGGGDFVSVICWIAGLGLICWLLWWLITFIGVPEPFAKVARVIIAVVAVIALIKIVVNVFGSPF